MEWYQKLARNGDVDALAKGFAGNWRSFSNFHWSGQPEQDVDAFMLFYTHSRDSNLLEESNAAAIAKILEKSEYEQDITIESHSHWANGWVAGYAIRCIDSEGHATPAFKALVEIAKKLDDYPVLDDEDYSERQYEAAIANIKFEGQNLVAEGTPENWMGKVFSWLWDNNQSAVEDSDDQGAYPNEEEIREALEDLGLLKEDEASE